MKTKDYGDDVMTELPAQQHNSDESSGLKIEDFHRIEMTGFNESTRTSQAIIWFKDRLIVGTGRAPLGFLGRYTASRGGKEGLKDQGDFGVSKADSGANEEDGAQIWSFDPATNTWKQLFNSPLVQGLDGKTRARDRSIRAAFIYQTESDPEPALYLGVGSLERQVVFLRSIDGETFEECKEHGFGLGDEDVPSVRTITGLNGRLYSTPTGKNYGRGMFDDNLTDFPVIFETNDPLHEHWRPVSEPGFGDPDNLSINDMVVMNGCLYAATVNKRKGFQLWKTTAEGKPPYQWTKILEHGAYRPISSFPSAMYVFKDALYIGCTLQRQGRGGRDRYGPFPAEMIRVYHDDSWDIVAGTPRFTPDGLKRPISGMQAGFNDRYLHVMWHMTEYNGWMYLGTAGWKWMPTYLRDRTDLSEEQLEHLKQETEKRKDGEFSLWRTRDGIEWIQVTDSGIPGGNPKNYGIRELLGTPSGLFMVPTSKAGSRQGGGLEIWWGTDSQT